jgi:hypothetical protein
MMSLVIDADGHVEDIEQARTYGDFFNTHQFTGLFESMARREPRRDPTILD